MELDKQEQIIFDRLGECEVCGSEKAKYTCPKCEVKTCCLNCVNIHKKELECDGIRNPTKFIRMDKFTNIDMLNDYRMLEHVNRVVDGLHNGTSFEYKNGHRILPKILYKMLPIFKERKISISFLPKMFQKRRKNRTYFNKTEKKIYWTLEWSFPHANNLKILENQCCEDRKLKSISDKYLTGKTESYSEKLSFYQAAGATNVFYLLKAEKIQGEKYFELDGDLSIKDNLCGRTLIEFPMIVVALKGHESAYDVITEDVVKEPVLKKAKVENEGDVVITQLLNEAQKEDSKARNLLFISEYSDVDMSTDEE